MSLKETVKQLWIKKIEKEYDKQLSEKKLSYDAWVKKQEASGDVLRNDTDSTDGYILFLQKRGCLNELAHGWITGYFAEHPEVQILYGDEDFLTAAGKRENPWYKPCWSPDTYLSQFYLGSVIAVRKELIEKTEDIIYFEQPEEVRHVLTECIRKCGGFEKGCKSVARCPNVLFHAIDEAVWESYLDSKEPGGNICKKIDDISVIIPSKDNPEILRKCLYSMKEITEPEIIVVDNGSTAENKSEIEKMIEQIAAGERMVKYLYHPMEFNFSKMCNIGAEAAKGRYLLFLNDDIEVCGTEWIYAMKEKAARDYVGAVGLKLYYPGGMKIQHAGITNLPVGPVHKMQFAEDNKSIYFDRNRADMNCLAVTGACLMIDKNKYSLVGGFKESLRVAYNDVDLGFALYEKGYHNVVLNSYYAYHHESLSRGSDESKEKLARLQKEREHLYEMHPALRNEDPYYPSGLSKDGPDSRIVPGYINVRNTIQETGLDECSMDMNQVRVDNCLFLGIEQSDKKGIKGYGVVLGDNNACYDRYVVLAEAMPKRESDPKVPVSQAVSEPVPRFVVKVQNMYRQDLEENMPDQTNVSLTGFHICFPEKEFAKLEKGAEYRIGVMAVHKINRGKLLNWSSRYYSI